MEDDRPIAEPTMFSFRSFEECSQPDDFVQAMVDQWEGLAQWFRFTIVDQEYPIPPHPDGYYFEGWVVRPEMMDPPHRQGPFAFPLTAAKDQTNEPV